VSKNIELNSQNLAFKFCILIERLLIEKTEVRSNLIMGP